MKDMIKNDRLCKKWASYLHRTATTTYPCFRQDLGIQQELVV